MKNLLNNIISWIKNNKISTALILIVLYLIFSQNGGIAPLVRNQKSMRSSIMYEGADMDFGAIGGVAPSMGKMTIAPYPPYNPAPPRPDITDRKVITNSSLSLQVKDVRDTMNKIKIKVTDLKGYVLNTNVSTPEFGESGSMSVRVPTAYLDEALMYFKGLAIKIVSENTNGSDITDQYVNYQERLARLNTTKKNF